MTLGHIASVAFFSVAIVVAVWAIVDSLRKEWRHVARTFSLPPGIDHSPPVDATSCPVAESPLGGGAPEAVR